MVGVESERAVGEARAAEMLKHGQRRGGKSNDDDGDVAACLLVETEEKRGGGQGSGGVVEEEEEAGVLKGVSEAVLRERVGKAGGGIRAPCREGVESLRGEGLEQSWARGANFLSAYASELHFT
jgi:hypothetical protein